ncbi:LPS translocon maturation chaperone LptM [Caldimonas brevitalea]|uniref:LPS translocon maturation chaperone LptM n=1 Tax=Caldimonas brevitalea TaxID=413882 RepID=UPI0009F849DF
MSNRALILAAGLATAFIAGLSACGQKGPLYLPSAAAPQGPASRASAASAAAPPAASAPAPSTPASR